MIRSKGIFAAAILASGVGAGAETIAATSAPAAAMTLARFTAGEQQGSRWTLETLEIEASLPKLKKAGRLRAVRKLLPARHPEYSAVQIEGDALVKQQVILRYFPADERAAELPDSAVAITPENYKVHYTGAIQLENGPAYTFRIVPRKRREGLINGVLWLDAGTGLAIRESGYLIKSPSFFVKRVNITRETDVRDGLVAAKITQMAIETRLVGTAMLKIVERPSQDETAGPALPASGQ